MVRKKGEYATCTSEPASPFAELAVLRTASPAVVEPADDEAGPVSPSFAAKVVLRRERAGRGGKTVTVVEGVLLQGDEREALLRRLRRTLGSSGRSEGDRLVFGGDVGDRLAALLAEAGARKVVRGN